MGKLVEALKGSSPKPSLVGLITPSKVPFFFLHYKLCLVYFTSTLYYKLCLVYFTCTLNYCVVVIS
jgi:hypothetical protein